jgi:hypothetical protein
MIDQLFAAVHHLIYSSTTQTCCLIVYIYTIYNFKFQKSINKKKMKNTHILYSK